MMINCGGVQRRSPPITGQSSELNRCLKHSAKKKYQKAVECLEVFKSRYPVGEDAAQADLLIADSYYRQKEYLLAAETYQDFIKSYPTHAKLDYAYYRSGLAYLAETPKAIDRDQEYLDVAIQNLEIVFKYFPESTYAKMAMMQYNQARSKMAERTYYIARFYYKYSEYLASIPRFEEIVTEYPHLGFDEKSYYYLIVACLKTQQIEKAKNAYFSFKENYPNSGFLKRAESRLKSS